MSRRTSVRRQHAALPPTSSTATGGPRPTRHRPRLGRLTRRLLLGGVAAAAATVLVSSGFPASTLAQGGSSATRTAALMADVRAAQQAPSSAVVDRLEAERGPGLSRSAQRPAVDRTKLRLLSAETTSGGQVTRTERLGGGDPKQVAQVLMGRFGFSADQFGCLDSLWTKESGWSSTAANPTSSAYGIPQALPGSKMASAGADWATNPATQITWGLGYIRDRYGSPCGAWSHSVSYGWY